MVSFGLQQHSLIPFFFVQSKVRLLSVFGAGILSSTALSVIIPEGVSSIYGASNIKHVHRESGGGGVVDHTMLNSTEVTEPTDMHRVVGITLLAGFLLMLLIDQISSSNSHGSYTQLPVTDADSSHVKSSVASRGKPKSTATIGLIVHSAGRFLYWPFLHFVHDSFHFSLADGIALGAAATTSDSNVELIIFLAIILHKAPAAFGLVTFLLAENCDRSTIKRHLFLFSLSAPFASMVTYFGISSQTREWLSEYNATGVALLFSSSTFLYVAAVHVLPEIMQHQRLKCKELIMFLGGSLLPPLFTINHHH